MCSCKPILPLVNTIHNSTPSHPSPLWRRHHFIAKRMITRMVVLGFGDIGINCGMVLTLSLKQVDMAVEMGRCGRASKISFEGKYSQSMSISIVRVYLLCRAYPFLQSRPYLRKTSIWPSRFFIMIITPVHSTLKVFHQNNFCLLTRSASK